jgi:Diadenosine tetraphosphate (Ap4A) hydrolase and other HIT family hydrolases
MGGKANMEDCVFCKIGSGEIQGLRICEDDEALAFMDISNDYDGHILVIPKSTIDM